MHSSRMRTARLLTVSQHALMGGVPAQVLPPAVNRMTDRCENITLPQTSFVGGKDVTFNTSQ